MSRASKRQRFIDAVTKHMRKQGVEVVALVLDDVARVDFIRRDGLEFTHEQQVRLDTFRAGYSLFGGVW